MNSPKVIVVAHRGFSGRYPENTALALIRAVELGVEMVEFDVHLTSDGVGVVIHDSAVDRTSDGSGAIADLTWDQIKSFDAGSWMGAEHAGQRFITIDDALELVPEPVRLNVHIKASDDDRSEVVSLVISSLNLSGSLSRSFIASDQKTIVCAKSIEPQVAVCNLSTDPEDSYIERSIEVGCTVFQPKNHQTDAAFCTEAHRHGLEVNPFYADDEQEMRRLINCGVDGILTNHPDRLIAVRDSM